MRAQCTTAIAAPCACHRSRWWQCSFPPADLEGMLRAQLAHNGGGYNEVIVTTAWWDANLPAAIEAVVSLGDDAKARSVHRAFVREYPDRLGQTPLVRYRAATGEAEDGFVELEA